MLEYLFSCSCEPCMIINLIGKKKTKKWPFLGPQDQHNEMGYVTASLLWEEKLKKMGGMSLLTDV